MTLNENRTAGCREVLLVCVGGKVSASAQNTNSPHEASSNIFIFLGRGRESESFSQLWPDKSDPPSHTATSHAHLQAPTNTTTNIVRLRDACQLRPLKSHVGPAARESRPGDHGDTRTHTELRGPFPFTATPLSLERAHTVGSGVFDSGTTTRTTMHENAESTCADRLRATRCSHMRCREGSSLRRTSNRESLVQP